MAYVRKRTVVKTRFRMILYIATFVVACVLTYIFAIDRPVYQASSMTMTAPGLPVVYFTSEGGNNYNYINGYLSDVDLTGFHGPITPIKSDRELTVMIKKYTNVISGISYDVRSLDGEELIERTELSDYTVNALKDGDVEAHLSIRNLIEEGKQYLLIINVTTEQYGTASFYTRIVIMDNANLDDKLDYAFAFNGWTYGIGDTESLINYITPNKTADNTDLGYVTLNNKLDQICYGDLSMTRIGNIYPTINEINGKYVSMTLRHMAKDSTGCEYNIKEYFRFNQADKDSTTYLYNYNRWMDQIFKIAGSVYSNGEIYLGICGDTELNAASSTAGDVVCFERDNALYSFKTTTGKYVKIFSFGDIESDEGLRSNYGEHGIKILSVDSDGNVRFLVYGYMNAGIREGKMGISVYEYDATDNRCDELIFISRSDSLYMIEKDINALSYVNDKGILYVYFNGSIYYLNTETKEYMLVADYVIPDSCDINAACGVLTYQALTENKSYENISEKKYSQSSFNLLNLETGEIISFDAKSGDNIINLGYIDDNIVYGFAHTKDIYEDYSGTTVFPMYKIVVADFTGKMIRDYAYDNTYVTGLAFEDNIIKLKRAMYNEEGKLVAMDDDRLLSSVTTTAKEATLDTLVTDVRQKEYMIKPVITASTRTTTLVEPVIKFGSDNLIYINRDDIHLYSDYYYAYGYGMLRLADSSLGDVITAAAESGGCVVDSAGDEIWNRYKVTKGEITLPEVVTVPDAEDVLDITGVLVDYALYFTGEGKIVMAQMGEGVYELIYAYNTTEVYTRVLETGETKGYTKTNFDTLCAASGGKIVVFDMPK